MAHPMVPEIEIGEETTQPQQQFHDLARIEGTIPASQTQQNHTPATPEAATQAQNPGQQNGHVAVPQIDAVLLRAIADGDLISFKKILGMEVPRNLWDPKVLLKALLEKVFVKQNRNENLAREVSDEEAGASANTMQNRLRGVTYYGKNNALHIVSGVMEYSQPMIHLLRRLFVLFLFTSLYLSDFFQDLLFYLLDLALIYKFLFSIDPLEKLSIVALFFLRSVFYYTFVAIFLRFIFPLELVLGLIPSEKFQGSISKLQSWYARVVIARYLKLDTYLPWWIKWFFFLPHINNLNRRERYLTIANLVHQHAPELLFKRNAMKETPLYCAAKAGKHKMVVCLIEFASPRRQVLKLLRTKNKQKETALHEAARRGYSRVVEVLLAADKRLASFENKKKVSPLYLAAASGSLVAVEALIKIDCDNPISFAGPDEETALHAAVTIRDGSITKEIIKWKPHLATHPDKTGNTPLHHAALVGNTCAVREILSKDTESVYKKNKAGSFPVHLAAESGSFAIINEILKKCPDAGELLNNKKRNFLHIAVEKKSLGLILSACRKGININVKNAKDKDGNTPLHLAVLSGDLEIFTLLFQNDEVNLNVRNSVGETPLDISARLQDNEFKYSRSPQAIIYRSLLARGAFPIPCDTVGVDMEKESAKYENMSKSLITGAVLIASAAFTAMFTVSGVYRSDDNNNWMCFKIFFAVDLMAFIFAVVSTSWLLHSALTNFHLKYRKFYFRMSSFLLYGAINLFILAFGFGGYIALFAINKQLARTILGISAAGVFINVVFHPKFIPFFLLLPYRNKKLVTAVERLYL